jgi:hypothetical protein
MPRRFNKSTLSIKHLKNKRGGSRKKKKLVNKKKSFKKRKNLNKKSLRKNKKRKYIHKGGWWGEDQYAEFKKRAIIFKETLNSFMTKQPDMITEVNGNTPLINALSINKDDDIDAEEITKIITVLLEKGDEGKAIIKEGATKAYDRASGEQASVIQVPNSFIICLLFADFYEKDSEKKKQIIDYRNKFIEREYNTLGNDAHLLMLILQVSPNIMWEQDPEGNTALHIALSVKVKLSGASRPHDKIKVLLEEDLIKQSINMKNNAGLTPLHISVGSYFGELGFHDFKLLIEKGADCTIKNNNEQTPYDYARDGRWRTYQSEAQQNNLAWDEDLTNIANFLHEKFGDKYSTPTK